MFPTDEICLSNMISMPYIGISADGAGDPETAIDNALWAHIPMIDTYRRDGNKAAIMKGIKKGRASGYDIFLIARADQTETERGRVKQSIFDDLEQFGTDSFDMYMLDFFSSNYVSIWKDLSELYHEGWIKSIGVCNFTIDQIRALKEISDVAPVVNEISSNPYKPQKELIEACLKEQVYPLCTDPFGGKGSGLLEEPVLLKLGKKYKKSPAQIVLRWNIERNAASLITTENQRYMLEDLNVFDFSLSSKEKKLIDALEKK
jgi:diketogulonate reductase-like aldo/keto reductase